MPEQMKRDLAEISLTNDYEKWRTEILQKMYRRHEGYVFNNKALHSKLRKLYYKHRMNPQVLLTQLAEYRLEFYKKCPQVTLPPL